LKAKEDAKKIAVYSAPGVSSPIAVPAVRTGGFNSTPGRGVYLNATLIHMGVLKAADDLFSKTWANAF
jgi:hypothetical protein